MKTNRTRIPVVIFALVLLTTPLLTVKIATAQDDSGGKWKFNTRLKGGIPVGGKVLGTNYMEDSLKSWEEAVIGSYGDGYGLAFGMEYNLCKNFSAECGLNWNTGYKHELKDEYMDGTSSLYSYDRTHINTLSLEAGGKFHSNDDKKFGYYGRGGVILPLYNTRVQENESRSEFLQFKTESMQTVKTRGRFFPGFYAAGGVEYKLNDNIGLHGELEHRSMTFFSKKSEITEWKTTSEDPFTGTTTTTDHLDGADTRDIETEYVKEIHSEDPQPSPDEPSKAMITSDPLGGFFVNFGISYSF